MNKYIIISKGGFKNNAPNLREQAFANFFVKKNLSYQCVNIGRDSYVISCFKLFRKILSIIDKTDDGTVYTIIFRDIFTAPTLILLLCSNRNIKYVQDFHGYYYVELLWEGKYLKSVVSFFFDFLANMLANTIFCVSSGILKHQLFSIFRSKGLLLENGVDLKVLNKKIFHLNPKKIISDNNILNIGFVGNAGIRFNMRYVIEELGPLDCVKLHIIGSGYNYKELKEIVSVNQYESVKFYGLLENDEVFSILLTMDCFITPYKLNYVRSRIPEYYAAKKNREYICMGKPILISNVPAKDKIFGKEEGIVLYEDEVAGSLQKAALTLLEKNLYLRKTDEISSLRSEIDFYTNLDGLRLFSD